MYPDEQFYYYTFAKEFGWTPTQIDEQPVYLLDWLMAIHQEVTKETDDN